MISSPCKALSLTEQLWLAPNPLPNPLPMLQSAKYASFNSSQLSEFIKQAKCWVWCKRSLKRALKVKQAVVLCVFLHLTPPALSFITCLKPLKSDIWHRSLDMNTIWFISSLNAKHKMQLPSQISNFLHQSHPHSESPLLSPLIGFWSRHGHDGQWTLWSSPSQVPPLKQPASAMIKWGYWRQLGKIQKKLTLETTCDTQSVIKFVQQMFVLSSFKIIVGLKITCFFPSPLYQNCNHLLANTTSPPWPLVKTLVLVCAQNPHQYCLEDFVSELANKYYLEHFVSEQQ